MMNNVCKLDNGQLTELRDEIDDDTLKHIFKVAKKMIKRCEDKLKCDGVTFLQNNGIAQDIKHFHLHLLPKYNSPKTMSMEKLYELLKED